MSCQQRTSQAAKLARLATVLYQAGDGAIVPWKRDKQAARLAHRNSCGLITHKTNDEFQVADPHGSNGRRVRFASRTRSSRESGTAELEEAVSAYGKALEVYNREPAPLQWAAIAANQGVALAQIAERQKDVETAKLAVNRIEAAIMAFSDGKDMGAANSYEARLAKARAVAEALVRDSASCLGPETNEMATCVK